MFRTVRWALIPCAVAAILAAPQSDKPLEPKAQPWKEKLAAEWTEEEAKQILSKSPWAQEAMLEPAPPKRSNMPQIGMGGGGMGYPGGGGMGGGRRGGGGGYPGGGVGMPRTGGGGQYPTGGGGQRGGRGPGGGRSSGGDYERPAPTTVRWESALPIHEAEEKAHDPGAPTVGKPDPNSYAIAVYGLQRHLSSDQAKDLKKQAMLQVDGMKDIKPSKVQVLQREEGSVILYWFPRSKKISVDDYAITFDAQFGEMRVVQTFILEKMMYNDKLEM